MVMAIKRKMCVCWCGCVCLYQSSCLKKKYSVNPLLQSSKPVTEVGLDNLENSDSMSQTECDD